MMVIVSAFLGLLAVALGAALAYQYRIKVDLQRRLFQDKADLYGVFMEKWAEIMGKRPSPEKISKSKEFEEFMAKFKLMLILYGSDEVYKSFVRMMKKYESGNRDLDIHDLGDIFVAMRKHLIPGTRLSGIDLLVSFITDIERHVRPGEWPPDWLKDILSNPA